MLASTYTTGTTPSSRTGWLHDLLANVGLVPASDPLPALSGWRNTR
ncbi:MAG TPA: hypothetical protein VFQ45_05905 [Longimicrobium sp.]|nr:hypothetical protein [Longimicrobium sp.]